MSLLLKKLNEKVFNIKPVQAQFFRGVRSPVKIIVLLSVAILDLNLNFCGIRS